MGNWLTPLLEPHSQLRGSRGSLAWSEFNGIWDLLGVNPVVRALLASRWGCSIAPVRKPTDSFGCWQLHQAQQMDALTRSVGN